VYVTPNWYIFGEAAGVPSVSSPVPGTAKRSWGPEQATGPPDTATAGDNTTAWASLSADGQDEWLRLHYDQPVVPAAVHVYETYNPGSVCRITAKTADGQEVELWSGIDPVSQEDAQGVARIGVKADFKTDCITVYLKSKEVPGWNEIDAVGLLDDAEQTHWAVSAEASSSWADGYGTSEVFSPEVYTPESSDQERIARLETEVGQLRRDLNALRDQVQAKTPRP